MKLFTTILRLLLSKKGRDTLRGVLDFIEGMDAMIADAQNGTNITAPINVADMDEPQPEQNPDEIPF